jgi:predicted CXXCH cytochrome family protein
VRGLKWLRGPGVWLFGPAAVWAIAAGAGLWRTASDAGAWGPVDRRAGGVATSQACAVCHPAQHASWRATYHRTMTQLAEGTAVLAPFAGESVEHLGFRATMTRTVAGAPHVTVVPVDGGAPLLDVDVAMTVGSHRYQQYVAEIDRGGGPGEMWRLPVAWHVAMQRWIPMNAAFLEPEGARGDAEDYLRHLSRWNDNCILCHNTEPVPGRTDRSDGSARFASSVGELGIACEACHGPAGGHVARQGDVARRLLAGAGDPAVAHPRRLAAREESGLCGRCHGNRIAADVASVLRAGDGFLPGDDLGGHSRPIWADSKIGGSDELPFAQRFWPDGTPRLSAYEYQGLLQSPCHADGQGLGCNDCHDMHGATPDMQVRAGRTGSGACAGCHTMAAEHGGHRAVDCLGCHMPRITYGLLEGMISHRIANPDPGAWVGRHDQPDACTQCHVDRSRAWAAAAMPRLGLAPGTTPATEAAEEAWASRVILDLYGGDPVQRVLAAHALTRPGVTAPASERLAWLVDALEDEYPAVRWMVWRAALQVAGELGGPIGPELARYDPHAEAPVRLAAIDALRAAAGPGPFAGAPERREALIDRQGEVVLWIGE